MDHFKILDLNENHADYLHDESRREGHAERICFPRAGSDVVRALETAAREGWPVTAQGGRTGVAGGGVPQGGLVVNLSRMDFIGHPEDNLLAVGPGATLSAIRNALAGTGLYFPPDPTETSATIGGMVGTNASGARSFLHGSVRNWIQTLEVVLASGKTIRIERGKQQADGLQFRLGGIAGKLPTLGIPAVKNAAGYFSKPNMDLIDLFIGAEGTLGIVAGIVLRLAPVPAETERLMAFFPDEAEALRFVHLLRDGATKPAAIEFFDFQSLELLRRCATAGSPQIDPAFHTAIYFEFDGEVPGPVLEAAEKATECWMEENNALQNLRHALPEAVNATLAERKRAIPELAKLGTDMAVPDDPLENAMAMYRQGLEKTGLEHVIFGHIGNNHLHVNILPRSLAEYETGRTLYREWAEQVVEMGGSVSAEHGIGKAKTALLEIQLGADGIREMKRLKNLFDPQGLLNPGTLFPNAATQKKDTTK